MYYAYDQKGKNFMGADTEQKIVDFCTRLGIKDYTITQEAPRKVVSLEEEKQRAIARVNRWTANKIVNGFQSACSGELATYDSDKDTQLTVSSDLNTINLAPDKFAEYFPDGYPMRGYPHGQDRKVVYRLSFEQLVQWNVDLALHRGKCKQEGWEKQEQVKACSTVEELNAITL